MLIISQQLDEMERLKRLILVGKTPLKECPPELFHHPVFVFWRMVNREVARASKKRADAYYRKLKASQRFDQVCLIHKYNVLRNKRDATKVIRLRYLCFW